MKNQQDYIDMLRKNNTELQKEVEKLKKQIEN
jgi:peptidoglycan hydrolase CwlO-like protein